MSISQTPDPWTTEVRRSAYVAVQVAALRREACERTFLYFLRSAQAHGLTTLELAEAAKLDTETVRRLTDPAAA